jgi:hypothetical protein
VGPAARRAMFVRQYQPYAITNSISRSISEIRQVVLWKDLKDDHDVSRYQGQRLITILQKDTWIAFSDYDSESHPLHLI